MSKNLVRVEADHGFSGKIPPRRRPALARALATIRRGEADGLLVLKLDRLGRNTRDLLDLMEASQREGWRCGDTLNDVRRGNSPRTETPNENIEPKKQRGKAIALMPVLIAAFVAGAVLALASGAAEAAWHLPLETEVYLEEGYVGPCPAAFTPSPDAVDFVTTGAQTGTSGIFPSNMDGTFGTRSNVPGIGVSDGTDVADMDNDGDNDFLYCDGSTAQVCLYTNDGAGTYTTTRVASSITRTGFCTSLRIDDFDGDGLNDFVVGDNRNMLGTKAYLQGPVGTFTVSATLDTSFAGGGNALFPIATGDINGDAYVDILVLGFSSTGSGEMQFYAGDGAGGFAAPIMLFDIRDDFGIGFPTGLAVLDLEQDGDLDIVAGGASDGTHFIYTNDGTGTFTAPGGPVFDVNNNTGLDAFDIDNDGTHDLIIVTWTTLDLRVALNTGGSLSAPTVEGVLAGRSIGVGAPPRARPIQPVFLILDEDSIDNGKNCSDVDLVPVNEGGACSSIEECAFGACPGAAAIGNDPSVLVNDDIASIPKDEGGCPLPLSINTIAPPAVRIWLPTGEVGDEGLFSPAPDAFVGLPNHPLGIDDYIFCPATADEHDLDGIAAAPLNALQIYALEGRTVCAVVHDSDISDLGPNAAGVNQVNAMGARNGRTAFIVTSVIPHPKDPDLLPIMLVDFLDSPVDVDAACECENLETIEGEGYECPEPLPQPPGEEPEPPGEEPL